MFNRAIKGSGLGFVVSLPLLGLDYLITQGTYRVSKLQQMADDAGCTYSSGDILSPTIVIPEELKCAMQNVTEWILSTSATYGNVNANSSLTIAAPVIVLGCVVIGGIIGGVSAYRARQTANLSLLDQLLEEGNATAPAVVVDRFNNGSSSPVGTRAAMFSAVRVSAQEQINVGNPTLGAGSNLPTLSRSPNF
jgi:hypothetical protein